MALFTVATFTGVDSNSLFPGEFAHTWAVTEFASDHYTLNYDDAELNVTFLSDGSVFIYDGSLTPTVGTFNQIVLKNDSGQELARWSGINAGPLNLFFSVGLPSLTINGNDTLSGNAGDDELHGGSGKDNLIGNLGVDRLHGGTGRDVLTGGAIDGDWFVFDFAVESRKGAANRDVITDFSHAEGDLLDFSVFDGNSKVAGFQPLHFIGAKPFHHKAGELHYVKEKNFVMLEADVDGNAKADFQVKILHIHKLFDNDIGIF
jgi:Ca2+-binding RTX toxin-like protein